MMTTSKTISDKKVFTQMFKALRKEGFKARQNFWCCQSCAWSDLSINHGIEDDDNVVFYHNQDNESFDRDGYLNSKIYLAWSGDGQKIKEVAELFGYEVEWDGTENQRIGIIPNPKARELD
ncbi:hypothetical protein PQE75_gp037 [Bacillus phage vB_BcoS-136]|uniref:DUF6891 domain-containing protein n=1 Tax=Bacillus phage vB_BcoS-136 TaxID=2419619 RepID=A0A3G3BV99_9CAUD|nr:hypothetical protein PQE75_gp037 [Bacillus phage vB_BcoS-136]AYP68169.1 hypothetical protein vBBcoS136_00037 [Bacillus phage vB_BcoS-136]